MVDFQSLCEKYKKNNDFIDQLELLITTNYTLLSR
jgi:hypothetical protein